MYLPLREGSPVREEQARRCDVDLASEDRRSNDGKSTHSSLGLEGRPVSRSRLQRLGIANTLMVTFGFLVSILFSAFIIFLYSFSPVLRVSQDDAQPHLWRQIVLRDQLAASITFSSAILRTFLGMQAAVAVSLIAADSLERSIVPLRLAPLAISMSASGWISFWSSLVFGWQMFRAASVYGCLLVVLLITSIASQFTSTLLVGDLGNGTLLKDARTETLAYGLSASDRASPVDGWTLSGDFPRFAEWSEPPTSREGWAVDTGPSVRAILPFTTAAERSALNTYKGFATILDTRFSCAAPGNESMYLQINENQSGTSKWTMNGTITAKIPAYHNETDWEIRKNNYRFYVDLSLVLPSKSGSGSKTEERDEWALLLFMPTPYNTASALLDSPLGRKSHVAEFLVLNITGDVDEWDDVEVHNYFGWVENMRGWSSDKVVTPWRYISHKAGFSVGMSLCFGSYGDLDTQVDISGGLLSSEPQLRWNPTERRFDRSSVEMLYTGAFYGSSLQDRGALALEKSDNWEINSRQNRRIATDSLYANVSKQLLLCSYCEAHYAWRGKYDPIPTTLRVHPMMVGTFQSILKSTGSLPLAMQTLWTVAAQRSWYDIAPRFEVKGYARYKTFGEAIVPREILGIGAVLGIIVVHNIAVAIVLILFLASLRQSKTAVGNLWQGFGQMASGDVADIASRASGALDKEVMAHLKITGDWDSRVRLEKGADDGVFRLRRKQPREA